jgi:hypothetical protein
MKPQKTLTILTRKIRKERNRQDYRYTLIYETAKGIKKMISYLEPTAEKARQKLNFRLNGLTQGASVVRLGK